MKRRKHIYPLVYDFQNLLLASRKAQKGKRFRKDVAQFNLNLEKEIIQLQHELKNKTYQHGAYHDFLIIEGKKRTISSAPYRDRVIHHALCNIIEPILDNSFIYDSYACRKGKGSHAAVDRATHFIRKNRYAIKIDIQKYFNNIQHNILRQILQKKIGDKNVLWLIDNILESYQPKSDYDEQGNRLFDFLPLTGIPIGNLTSQLFANVYMNYFDHYVKEVLHCEAYIRYVDDFILLSDSKRRLNEWKHEIVRYLKEHLHLSIHDNKSHVIDIKYGIDFLGYRIFKSHRLLRNGNGHRFLRKLKRNIENYHQGIIPLQSLTDSVVSWVGHVSHADSWGLRTSIFNQAVI